MIVLQDVCKTYRVKKGYRSVLNKINLTINPGEKIGILGRNGSGKSTLIKIISGAERPCKGKIVRRMSVSWPLAFSDAFQHNQTGIDCIRFIYRIYGLENLANTIDFVNDFSELGEYLYEPIGTYSSGMRARLSFAISMAVEFDCFLIDEVIAVGDDRFHQKCYKELFEKRNDRSYVIVSHDPSYINAYCNRAAVLMNGQLSMFNQVPEAYQFYSIQRPMISRDMVIAGYQFILGRDPENESAVTHHQAICENIEAVRKTLYFSEEFKLNWLNQFTTALTHIILNEEQIYLGFKLILGREPTTYEIKKYHHTPLMDLRVTLLHSEEFKQALKKLYI